jgi:hypothetical protein
MVRPGRVDKQESAQVTVQVFDGVGAAQDVVGRDRGEVPDQVGYDALHLIR